MTIKRFLQHAAGTPVCLICGRRDLSSAEFGLCLTCIHTIIFDEAYRLGRSVCRRCGIVLLSEMDLCSECRLLDDRVRNSSLYAYAGIFKDLVQFYKFQGYKNLSLFFSNRMDCFLSETKCRDWTLVPVPPGKGKIFRTGWDQIDLILKDLQKKGWKRSNILADSGGRSQKTLGREQRLRESENRYYVKKGVDVPEKVIIIDDVFTTGATIRCCTDAVLARGAQQVCSLTIARD